MKVRLNASSDNFNSQKEARYCIEVSQQFIEKQKKAKFLNKLNFDYSLEKINKEKIYGRLISTATQIYPKTFYEGSKYASQQYSNAKIRQHRRSFIKYMEQPVPQHHQSIKKYTQILSKKKKQGGLDSFWFFKKQVNNEEEKQKNGEVLKIASRKQKYRRPKINRIEEAFKTILQSGKQSKDASNSVISKIMLKNYISCYFGETFALWFVSFYRIKNMSFKDFQILSEKIKKISLRQSHLVSFFLYDQNGDGLICPRDVFGVFERWIDKDIEKDVLKIANFTKNNFGREDNQKGKFKFEQTVILDDLLTVKDYEMYFKKVDEPFLKATNKKDTAFSKTFVVMDHRQKIRSVRRQMNKKKMMYNEIYGKIAEQKRNHPFIAEEDYKLSFSFFFEAFNQKMSNLFIHFRSKIFGV